jgi:xanthine/CO dehydrogenase XdhC/CoxF family maturation factor
VVLAIVLRTEGSTYRKTGACALMDPSGASSGILSGGCLEADLRERATQVLANNRPTRIVFDTRGVVDSLWGLSLGCEGLMDIWLQPARPENDYGLLPYLLQCWEQEHGGMVAMVVGGEALTTELGQWGHSGAAYDHPLQAQLARVIAEQPGIDSLEFQGRKLEVFAAPITLPPALLLCGAGPDAIPIADFAASLGWRVTVFDHRPAYARAENFPESTRVILGRPEELTDQINLSKFDAALIMSHHFPSDVEYLRRLARSPPSYVGALGPGARRERLLAEAGAEATAAMRSRLFGPVGLEIGANSPETIALAIVAQIHALRRKLGLPLPATTTIKPLQ